MTIREDDDVGRAAAKGIWVVRESVIMDAMVTERRRKSGDELWCSSVGVNWHSHFGRRIVILHSRISSEC